MYGKDFLGVECTLVEAKIIDGSTGEPTVHEFAEDEGCLSPSGAATHATEPALGLTIDIELDQVSSFGHSEMVPFPVVDGGSALIAVAGIAVVEDKGNGTGFSNANSVKANAGKVCPGITVKTVEDAIT